MQATSAVETACALMRTAVTGGGCGVVIFDDAAGGLFIEDGSVRHAVAWHESVVEEGEDALITLVRRTIPAAERAEWQPLDRISRATLELPASRVVLRLQRAMGEPEPVAAVSPAEPAEAEPPAAAEPAAFVFADAGLPTMAAAQLWSAPAPEAAPGPGPVPAEELIESPAPGGAWFEEPGEHEEIPLWFLETDEAEADEPAAGTDPADPSEPLAGGIEEEVADEPPDLTIAALLGLGPGADEAPLLIPVVETSPAPEPLAAQPVAAAAPKAPLPPRPVPTGPLPPPLVRTRPGEVPWPRLADFPHLQQQATAAQPAPPPSAGSAKPKWRLPWQKG